MRKSAITPLLMVLASALIFGGCTAIPATPDQVYKELLKGETIAIVMEHELHGVTPEMIDWWWDNMDNDRYISWDPEDHIALVWQIPPARVGGHVGAIHIVCEKFGPVPPQILRIRWEEPGAAPIKTIYSHVNVGSPLGLGDVPTGNVVHEYEATSYGTQMRSTFTLPGTLPQRFYDALRVHNVAEMGHFPDFLPKLYKQNTGK